MRSIRKEAKDLKDGAAIYDEEGAKKRKAGDDSMS